MRSSETDRPFVIRDQLGDGIVRILTARGRPSTLAWAPTGRWLAAGVGSEIELLDPLQGTRSELLRGSKGNVDRAHRKSPGVLAEIPHL